MATYNKRGYKPKTKAEKVDFDEQQSTTAEVFNTLDESASKTEEWVAKNQNYILWTIGAIALIVLGYLAYNQFVEKPKETNAANEMYYPQQYFNQALVAGVERDSLFNLALNGAEGKYGFLDIIEEYSGTASANLATYAAGMSYLRMGNYTDAIDYLEDFSSDDVIFNALANGGLGDAFAQLDQSSEALGYYEKAFAENSNNYTTPKYLYKAGITAMDLNENATALEYFQRIKDEFSNAPEANTIDAFIAMAKNK